MDVARFRKTPVLGILRGVEADVIEPLAETVIKAGLGAIEIAMNTAGAPQLIEKMKRCSNARIDIGAGTVLDNKALGLALDAGATFIVTPVFVEDVVASCVKRNIPVFAGALTPSEVWRAWQAKATMVKVFPSGFFGPEYFKELKGPFNDMELLACGGVTPDNIGEYFRCGASAAAFGASVFRKEWLAVKDFVKIGNVVKEFVDKVKYR
jgi:2-dehydro-3-deoxyphosphogluconate aldolase/(4S)-4-hydroxy-2-oxoglutarate aldolase